MPSSPTGRDFPSTSQPLPCIGSEMPNARSLQFKPVPLHQETVLPGGHAWFYAGPATFLERRRRRSTSAEAFGVLRRPGPL